jgi:hypothetical protein
MRGMPRFVVAVVAVLVTISACSTSHSSPSAKTHAKTIAQQGQEVIDAQKQVPPLQTTAQFCLDGIFKKEAQDQAISVALNNIDPTGGEATAWTFHNLEDDQVTVKKEFASGQIFSGTFDLGQIIYAIIDATGEQVTKGTPDQIQWKLFGLLGPAAIYCAEAALWLDGNVGGQIGTALQKKFLTLPVGQQLLASRGSAITGKWVLYRRLKSCSVTGNNNHGCQLSSMDVTIACTGTACTITRTNASAGFEPWDHSIPIAFGQGAWQASGTEKWAAECNQAPVPGSGVALALKVTSGQVVNGVWRAQGLEGSFTVNNVATACFPAGTSLEEASTTSFAGSALTVRALTRSVIPSV